MNIMSSECSNIYTLKKLNRKQDCVACHINSHHVPTRLATYVAISCGTIMKYSTAIGYQRTMVWFIFFPANMPHL